MPPPGDYTLTPVEHDPWAEAQTHQAERPNPAAPIVNFGKLFAKTMADRAISAVTAPRDALYGNMQVTDPETGMPTQEAMQRGKEVANLAMTGGIPFAKASAAGMAGGKLTQPEGIVAYHSSPHDFDRFDISKVGTGQGAAAYGHGIYAAENPAVSGGPGSEYWNEFARTHGFNTKNDPEGQAVRMLEGTRGDRAEAIKKGEDALATGKWNSKNAPHLPAAIDLLKSDKPVGPRTYQVAIKAPPEHFLDWDKPLSEQPEKVKELWGKLFSSGEASPYKRLDVPVDPKAGAYIPEARSGDEIYRGLTGAAQGASAEMEAIKALREAGIPGVKYLDQGSRGAPKMLLEGEPIPAGHTAAQMAASHLEQHGTPEAAISALERGAGSSGGGNDPLAAIERGMSTYLQKSARQAVDLLRSGKVARGPEGTRNYVVFDDKLIDILKKYGIAGLAALPAAGGYHFRTQEVDHDPFGQ